MGVLDNREQKSADRLAFEHYLRTGHRLTGDEWERKFNPNHDPEDGRFTFAPGGAASGSSSPAMTSRRTNGGKPYPARIELPNGGKPYPVRIELPPSVPPRSTRAAQERHSRPDIRFGHRPDLDLSPPVVAKANVLSDSIRSPTGYRLYVTSGRRNENRQAKAMYDNYADKTPPKYANRLAEQEVRRVYDQGKAAGRIPSQIIADMAVILTNQTRRGIFISRHMRSGAIDILTPPSRVLHAIRNHPSVQSVGVENDHIHIQFH